MNFLTDSTFGTGSLIVLYLLIANLALLLLMGLDKSRSKRRGRRIPEVTLFLLAIIGGSLGGLLGMCAFRHKTKHASFVFGFPVILALQIALSVFVIFYM